MKKVFDILLGSATIAPTKENQMKTEQKPKNNSLNLPPHIVSIMRVNAYCAVLALRRERKNGDKWSYTAGHEAGTKLAYTLANKTVLEMWKSFGPK